MELSEWIGNLRMKMDSSQLFSLTTVLATTTLISTILQYLSGGLVVYKYIRNKSTGDSSPFPFICGFLSCSLWLKYGFLANEKLLVLVNTIGATLFLSYVIIFWRFTLNKRSTCRQLFSVILVLGITITYTEWYEINQREAIEVMGYLCCFVTVVFFAAPCCMLLQVIRTRATEILPFPLILMSFLVSIQWFIFGVIAGDHFIQIPNLLGTLLSGTQLLLFLIYPNKQRPQAFAPNGEVPYAIF